MSKGESTRQAILQHGVEGAYRVGLGGSGEHGLFAPEMLRGGYRKKDYRALSRLGALAEQGRALGV